MSFPVPEQQPSRVAKMISDYQSQVVSQSSDWERPPQHPNMLRNSQGFLAQAHSKFQKDINSTDEVSLEGSQQ